MRRITLAAALLAACGTTPTGDGDEAEDAAVAARADEPVLDRPTLVIARTVKLVLSERWRDDLKIEGLVLEGRDGPVTTARGSAVLRLRKLRVEASEEIAVHWQDDAHSDVLLSARDVTRFKQREGFDHSSENLSLAVMANDQVSFFK